MLLKSPLRYLVAPLLLVFVVTDVYFAVTPANGSGAAPLPEPPPPVKAILKTTNSMPISVNGAAAADGATIMTGSVIETPDQVGAVISLGSAGELEINPGSSVKLEFDANGNMKVTVARGCTTARAKKNILAEVYTSQGLAGETDQKKNRKALTVCFPPGATAPTVSFPAGAAAASTGIGLVEIISLTVVGTTGLILIRGTNPSPSAP